ncbi:MAG: polyphosphate kinase, partial [Chitinophagaceae bacterium]|nr:polyphosphate kinase [Chitinophagaceae bacterium]
MKKIKLSDIATVAPKGIDKDATKKKTKDIKKELDDLQNLLYAESKHSILIILQGMDASGKDGTIRKVLGHM